MTQGQGLCCQGGGSSLNRVAHSSETSPLFQATTKRRDEAAFENGGPTSLNTIPGVVFCEFWRVDSHLKTDDGLGTYFTKSPAFIIFSSFLVFCR